MEERTALLMPSNNQANETTDIHYGEPIWFRSFCNKENKWAWIWCAAVVTVIIMAIGFVILLAIAVGNESDDDDSDNDYNGGNGTTGGGSPPPPPWPRCTNYSFIRKNLDGAHWNGSTEIPHVNIPACTKIYDDYGNGCGKNCSCLVGFDFAVPEPGMKLIVGSRPCVGRDILWDGANCDPNLIFCLAYEYNRTITIEFGYVYLYN